VPPWVGLMSFGEFLERNRAGLLVHTPDLAQATGQAAGLDRRLVREALEPARQVAPVLRMFGEVGRNAPWPRTPTT
jgi:hypothetical protein